MLNNCHLSKLVLEQAKKYGERTALNYRDYDKNQWIPISWNSFAEKVKQTSLALLRLGVKVQENIAVFSQNKPETHFVDFGAYGIRAVTIPFYATSSGSQITYMINDADIRFLFVGEQQQYDTAFGVMQVAQTLERIIIFDPKVVKNEKDHLSVYLDDFLKEQLAGDTSDLEAEYEHSVHKRYYGTKQGRDADLQPVSRGIARERHGAEPERGGCIFELPALYACV